MKLKALFSSFVMLITLSLGAGPRSLEAAEALEQRVAILQLKNRLEVSAAEIDYLTSVVRLEAAKALPDSFLVMTQENIVSLLPPEQRLEDCESECEVDMGRLLGARYIITGEVLRFGSSLRLTMKLHDTKSGRLVGSEIAKGARELEELEGPTSSAIRRLLITLTQEGAESPRPSSSISPNEEPSRAVQPSSSSDARTKAGLRGRADQELSELSQGRAPAQGSAPPRGASKRAQSAPAKRAQVEPSVKPRARATKQDKPHPRWELHLGMATPQCSPNGDATCEGALEGQFGLSLLALNYKLFQLSSFSVGLDLQYLESGFGSDPDFPDLEISSVGAGLTGTLQLSSYFGRLSLGIGAQTAGGFFNDSNLSYEGNSVRFGLEGGVWLGAVSLSMYMQNEFIPQETEVCLNTPYGDSDCVETVAAGVRQVGFKLGLTFGE